MYLEGIIIFCLAIADLFLCYAKVAMANDPIVHYLQLNPKTEYQFLKKEFIRQFHKRDLDHGIPVEVESMDENLLLYPQDQILAMPETPVYYGIANANKRGGVEYVLCKDAMENVGILLRDPENLASLVISRDENNRTTVNGIVRSKRDDTILAIRSLPDHVVKKNLRKRRSTNDSANEDLPEESYYVTHVIAKVGKNEALKKPRKARDTQNTQENKTLLEILSEIQDDPQNDCNRTLYPKLLIHLDSSYYHNQTGNELTRLLEYLLAFWNGVELSYRNLKYPNFKFHIAAITIATSPAAIPYISNFQNPNDETIFFRPTIVMAAHFHYDIRHQIPFHMYDIAVTITKSKMTESSLGAALRGHVCWTPYGRGTKDAVALVQDDGAFAGIYPAVHELGHVFGLDHDGENGDASGDACERTSGFVMEGSTIFTNRSSLFSACSLAELRRKLRAKDLECLYNPPTKIAESLPLLMPGKVLNLDQQCQVLNHTRACSSFTELSCLELRCLDKIVTNETGSFEHCQNYDRSIAPGSRCGKRNDAKPRFCLQNRCVSFN